MQLTVQDIADALGAKAFGATDLIVTGLAEPASASETDLALAITPKFTTDLAKGLAQAAVLAPGADWKALRLRAAIVAPRGRLAMARLTQLMDQPSDARGIHPTAHVDPTAQIGENVALAPFAVIGAGAVIGPGSKIGAHTSVADSVTIGADCTLHAGVRLGRNVTIGNNVILQPNVVIGGDGFSFVTAMPSHVEIGRKTLGKVPFTAPDDPAQYRIHSLGGVIIGDDVEIGANATIDAGTIRATQIGRGTKIDNLVQVGHNVVIGEHCLLCAQVGVAGSSVLGDRVIVGGKAGIGDNLTIGSDCVIGAAAVVLSPIPDGGFVMGSPAVPMLQYRAQLRAMRQKTVSKPGQSN